MLETKLANIIQKSTNVFLVLVFIGITLATTGLAGIKLYNAIKAYNLEKNASPENGQEVGKNSL